MRISSETPRLTSTLRSFSQISLGYTPLSPERKRQIIQEKLSRNPLCVTNHAGVWQEIKRKLIDAVKEDSTKKNATETAISKLTVSVGRLVGSDQMPEIKDDAMKTLFLMLVNEDSVSESHRRQIKSKFPFLSSLNELDQILPCCHRIRDLIGAGRVEAILNCGSSIKFMDKPFGHNIELPDQKIIDFSQTELPNQAKRATGTSSTRSMNFSEPKPAVGQEPQKKTGSKITGTWLDNQMKQWNLGSSALLVELKKSMFEILSSTTSDEDIQNDLFDLLGFDRFDFIQTVIENRRELVRSMISSIQASNMTQNEDPSTSRQPVYGAQITIQSESDKRNQKELRREEKKINRLFGKPGQDNSNQELFMDTDQLRALREDQLQSAVRRPTERRIDQSVQQRYPYVFDPYLDAKRSAAFIAGAQISLPENCVTRKTGSYQEITFPPENKIPPSVGDKTVPISSLDEVGQMAFHGMKSLNRIQSVVFETAYKTNENLLICAPTGAGKTNIAMLTILHTIKQHMEDGVIRKDKFKIVYVAPMKALAAEMVANFGKKLQPLGISVRELTGDMGLTKQEILNTQMLVTTPEKWDVVTRKSTGDVALVQLVKLLIIDEVHLLAEERGAVIEILVARTLRQVESSQSMIRIVGLSATLPNYLDVMAFLRVNPYRGLFFFGEAFRPVPLEKTLIGVKGHSPTTYLNNMNEVCYEKVVAQVKKGEQVMVFVHSRAETVRTAETIKRFAEGAGTIMSFMPEDSSAFGKAKLSMQRSRNRELKKLFDSGFGMHNAGMLRSDRNLVEKYFSEGLIRVLVTTATLAWGVNLPAHAVIIKGTDIYDSKKGSFVDLGILDVLQIFGRAGRPQFDTSGHGTIICKQDKLSMYLSMMTRQDPIESQFIDSLTDHLNAEVCLGTVTNMEEAVQWLSYTFLFVRMKRNPLVYGLTYKDMESDPLLDNHRQKLLRKAAMDLDKARMIRFDERNGSLSATDLGRTSSHYYIKFATVMTINEKLKTEMGDGNIYNMVCGSEEFTQLKERDEEKVELEKLFIEHSDSIPIPKSADPASCESKVNILLRTHIERGYPQTFSLVSDLAYIKQNAPRIMRALFEVTLRKGWSFMTGRLLQLCKVVELQLTEDRHPLWQFSELKYEIMTKLERGHLYVERLREMEAKEIGAMVRHNVMGTTIKTLAHSIPRLELEATIQPITRTVLRVKLQILADFNWIDKYHGNGAQQFWIWVEDPESNHIYHHEMFTLQKKQVLKKEELSLVFTIPIFEPLPSQYYVRCSSDHWLGSETTTAISFKHLILPERHPPHTELLNLQPLPKTALKDVALESLFSFTHFNPVQTQIFHTIYHTDCNVLLGAPTGSGKTVAAEMAIFRLFREYPGQKAVYIAPLKALVRERMEDWRIRIEQKLGKRVVEMTGDVAPDMRAIAAADLIVTTPEKWDGVSRSWQNRGYVQKVTLIVIDEIHLLGADRGPVLEVVVSRTNFISATTGHKVRVVGLSTALANARDLADWLGIKQTGLFNFKPAVRPVPLSVHISGFPGKHYCPRMATMNKPCFQAIQLHSPEKPVLIFVSSRRQTRLTALDLISLLAGAENPKQWLNTEELEMMNIISGIKEANLKLTLAFGIGLHHAGLHERDRKTVEELFVNQKIQVLVATSTLAWGVNFPAHLVIVKGTEYFDGKLKRYVDFPITDVLQMMGRAGRPQFDDNGVAVILVHDTKKQFYKKFLYEPFPVESSLLGVIPDHLNAEIVAGTINNKQEAMDYITWTYFFRRLVQNPSYYELDETDPEHLNKYLSSLVESNLRDIQDSGCITVEEDNYTIRPETLGHIASYYYLSHKTVRLFCEKLNQDSNIEQILINISDAEEYAELPVRHNEDQLNSDLLPRLPLKVNTYTLDDSHTKTFILLQCHLSRCPLPIADYLTDTKSVMDQAIRVIQAMLDLVADGGWLMTSLYVINTLQMIIQGRWNTDSSFLSLPNVDHAHLPAFRNYRCLPQVVYEVNHNRSILKPLLEKLNLNETKTSQVEKTLQQLPLIHVNLKLKQVQAEDTKIPAHEEIIPTTEGDKSKPVWIKVKKETDYTVHANLIRQNHYKRSHNDNKALAPVWPKPKDEGWFIILGEIETKELWALKRVPYVRGQTTSTVAILTPEQPGRHIFTFYLLSDSYLGFDQQFNIHMEVE